MKLSSRVAADSVGRDVGVCGRTHGHTHVLFVEKYGGNEDFLVRAAPKSIGVITPILFGRT